MASSGFEAVGRVRAPRRSSRTRRPCAAASWRHRRRRGSCSGRRTSCRRRRRATSSSGRCTTSTPRASRPSRRRPGRPGGPPACRSGRRRPRRPRDPGWRRCCSSPSGPRRRASMSVSMSTAVWIVMCSEPEMRAPASGLDCAVLLAQRHQAGHLVLGEDHLLAAERRHREIGDAEVPAGRDAGRAGGRAGGRGGVGHGKPPWFGNVRTGQGPSGTDRISPAIRCDQPSDAERPNRAIATRDQLSTTAYTSSR